MKRLNLRCLVTIFCILLFVTTTIFVLKQPLHKIKSEDLIGLETGADTLSYITLNSLYKKSNDEYVQEYFLRKLIDAEKNPKRKIELIKKLKGLTFTYFEFWENEINSTLLYYGRFDIAKELNKKIEQNYDYCQGILTTRGEYLSCKLKTSLLPSRWSHPQSSQHRTDSITHFEKGKLYKNNGQSFKHTKLMMKHMTEHFNKLNNSEKARYYYTKNDLAKTKYYLDRALKSSPYYYSDVFTLYLVLGEEYMQSGNYKMALECFKTYLTISDEFNKSQASHNIYAEVLIEPKSEVFPGGSYYLHEKLFECYTKLGDKKNARIHETIMKEMLSW